MVNAENKPYRTETVKPKSQQWNPIKEARLRQQNILCALIWKPPGFWRYPALWKARLPWEFPRFVLINHFSTFLHLISFPQASCRMRWSWGHESQRPRGGASLPPHMLLPSHPRGPLSPPGQPIAEVPVFSLPGSQTDGRCGLSSARTSKPRGTHSPTGFHHL